MGLCGNDVFALWNVIGLLPPILNEGLSNCLFCGGNGTIYSNWTSAYLRNFKLFIQPLRTSKVEQNQTIYLLEARFVNNQCCKLLSGGHCTDDPARQNAV